MLKRCSRLLKGKGGSHYLGGGKSTRDDTFGQVAMEYIYEKNHVNDAKKRAKDIEQEQTTAQAFDRYAAVSEYNFEQRMTRLIDRMNEAMDAIPEQLRSEACELNTQQPPLNFRRPTLTPPFGGYEPGFGFDVPQLRVQTPEYPPIIRDCDEMEFGETQNPEFPYLDTSTMQSFTEDAQTKLDRIHGEVRATAPVTGAQGEAWEALVALNKKALARQKLLIELEDNYELGAKFEEDPEFREKELLERGITSLEFEEAPASFGMKKDEKRVLDIPFTKEPKNVVQEPLCEPFRKM